MESDAAVPPPPPFVVDESHSVQTETAAGEIEDADVPPPPPFAVDEGRSVRAGFRGAALAGKVGAGIKTVARSPPRKKRWLCMYGQPAAQAGQPALRERPSWYKADPCYFYSLGTCNWGEDCNFLHSGEKARNTEGESWRRVMPCYLDSIGACKFGDDCYFKHGQEGVRDGSSKSSDSKPCYFYSFGNCSYGKECKFAHSGEKAPAKACYFYSIGTCNWGKECNFSHTGGEKNWEWQTHSSSSSGDKSWSWSEAEGSWTRDWVKSWGWGQKVDPCALFQLGCCWFGNSCSLPHVLLPKESGLKTMLCSEYTYNGKCPNDECSNAHGKDELQTPKIFQGMPGYKSVLCTFFVCDGCECVEESCFDAHGELDLRRQELTIPPSLSGHNFVYSDSHVHLDHVLLSRRYGTYWFYKHQTCRRPGCSLANCMWVHDEDERQARPLDKSDLVSWVSELEALTPGTFGGCIHSCCDASSIASAVDIVRWGQEVLGGRIFGSFGIHPSSFEEYNPEVESRLAAALEACGQQGKAWGECGLDYYRQAKDKIKDADVRVKMREVFERQVDIAVARGMPITIHSRDAEEDTLEVLRKRVPPSHFLHLHCYMGSVSTMRAFLERWPNSCVGIAGAITYSGAADETGGLGDLVRALPLERMVLETDGPYMAPEPYRGEVAHPGQIPWIAETIARIKGVSTAEVLATTHKNFCWLYGV